MFPFQTLKSSMQIQIISNNPVSYLIVHARDLKSLRLMVDVSLEVKSRLKLVNAILMQGNPLSYESMNLIYVFGIFSRCFCRC